MMNSRLNNILSLTFFLFVLLIQSCVDGACKGVSCFNNGVCVEGICDCPEGFAGSDCSIDCGDMIFGVWSVTDIRPVGCTVLTYEFGAGSSTSILSVILDDGTRKLTGSGLLDPDCNEMTYTVSDGGAIVSGAITFDGSELIDKSDFGCLIYADKQ